MTHELRACLGEELKIFEVKIRMLPERCLNERKADKILQISRSFVKNHHEKVLVEFDGAEKATNW